MKPNILLFLTDQQRFDTIGALGNPVIKTPSLDRLCRMGTAFTSAYTPSPVCISARCSLHYGQHPMRTGCFSNNSGSPPVERETFFAALTRTGYRTHAVGKLHFKPDIAGLYGLGSRDIQEEFCPIEKDDYIQSIHARGFDYVCDPHGARGEMYYVPQISPFPADRHPTHWAADRSIDFISDRAGGDDPWFLTSSFIHPHPPFNPPNPWHKLYRAALMPLPKLPPDYESLQTHINRLQNRRKYRGHGMDLDVIRTIKAYYYACISFVDQQVGRILDTLERTGQLDNTLILFSSDHGEHLGDYGCWGKRSMHDSCARIPLLACRPGHFPAGRRCDNPVSLLDVTATILQAAGATIDTHELDGVSLVDRIAQPPSAVFGQYETGDEAIYYVVTEKWKYAYSAADGREFLFDRVGDPGETRNRAGIQFLRPAQDAMKALLIDHLTGGGQTGNITEGTWRDSPRLELDPNPDATLRIVDHGWAKKDIPGYTDTDQTRPVIG